MANRINSVKITSPYDLLEKCAQMELEDVPVNYVFPDITQIGKIYTLTFHVKAESDCTMYIGEETIPVSTDWKRVSFVFTALEKTLKFEFRERGIYYFFNTQLEEGNKATTYRPAPEDITVENVYVPDTKEIDGGKIYVESIRAGAIAAEAIETRHIAANAIIANHINAGAVTAEKLTVGTGGNLYTTYDIFAQLRDGVDANGIPIQNIYFQKSETATVSLTDEIKGYYGDKILKIQSSGSDTHVYLGHSETRYGCVSVVPGGNYFISMYVRCDRGTSSASFEVCEHERQDSVVTNHVKSEIAEIDSKWKRISYKYIAGDDCSYISLRINHEGASGSSIYVDAIQIERVLHTVTEPSDFKPAGTVVIDGGNIVANSITSAKIGAEQILANHIVGNAIDASKIKAGTLEALWVKADTLIGGVLKSKETITYDQWGYTTDGFIINLAGQEIKAQNFKILADGSAYLRGEIVAESGYIAEWEIGKGYMRNKDSSNRYVGVGVNGTAYAFYAGGAAANGSDGVFRVGHDGELTATKAKITGEITANGGSIGGFKIESNYLYRNTSSGVVWLGLMDYGTGEDGFEQCVFGVGPSLSNPNGYFTITDKGSIYGMNQCYVLASGNTSAKVNVHWANENNIYDNYRFGLRASSNNAGIYFYGLTGSAAYPVHINRNTGVTTIFTGQSDRRLKNDLGLINQDDTLALLKDLDIHSFTYKNDDENIIYSGVMAQDLIELLKRRQMSYVPALIISDSEGNRYQDIYLSEDIVEYGMDYTRFIPYIWKGWQYHDEQISALDTHQIQLQTQLDHALQEIEKLKNEIKELKTA